MVGSSKAMEGRAVLTAVVTLGAVTIMGRIVAARLKSSAVDDRNSILSSTSVQYRALGVIFVRFEFIEAVVVVHVSKVPYSTL